METKRCICCKQPKLIEKFQKRHKSETRCNICNHCHYLKYFNHKQQKVTQKKYRQSDAGKKGAVKRMNKYKTNSRDKYLKTQRKYTKKAVDTLSDSYIIECFKANGGKLTTAQYKQHPQLIEAQRALLTLKRALK